MVMVVPGVVQIADLRPDMAVLPPSVFSGVFSRVFSVVFSLVFSSVISYEFFPVIVMAVARVA